MNRLAARVRLAVPLIFMLPLAGCVQEQARPTDAGLAAGGPTATARLLPTVDSQLELTLVASPTPAGPTGAIHIAARDADTGYGLAAALSVYPGSQGDAQVETQPPPDDLTGVWQLNRGGETIELPEGNYNFAAALDGYAPMVTHFMITAGHEFAVVFWMIPLSVAPELQPELVDATHRPGYTMLHGYVVDQSSGEPLEGVQISLKIADVSTQTNPRGYFMLQVPSSNRTELHRDPDDLLVAELSGYTSHIDDQIYLVEGVSTFIIDLEPEDNQQSQLLAI